MKIGPGRPVNAIRHGLYAGTDPLLLGHTALISEVPDGWLVQVDDRYTNYSYGWWWFPREDWHYG